MNARNDHIVIIGTGFAGICMGIRLKQAGIHDFTLFEQAGQVGGTWRDNHYPGAACDVQSHLYCFSFEPNPDWSRMFAPQPEILAYLERCVDKYGLRPHIRFNTEITGAAFAEQTGLWTVETSDGKAIKARAVVAACGGLSRPVYPDITGLRSFKGKMFHSARWDHDYPLQGKKVAVIGTGASAIQIVPSIASRVAHLDLYQRTPPWILPKEDRPIGPMERALFRRAPLVQQLVRQAIYWMLEQRALAFVVQPSLVKSVERQSIAYMRSCISDPALREKLTPRYRMGCKRVLITNDYYPALARDNVDVVTDGIEEIREDGIVTKDGEVRPVDAIIFATGFVAAEAVAPFTVRGRRGQDLNDAWRDGAEAYLGTTVSGFPNMFLIVGPNTGLGHNSMVYMIESQAQYILSCLQTMRRRGLRFVDVRPDAQSRYNAKLRERFAQTVWATGGCKSWYVTRTGKNTTLWPGFTFEFRARTHRFDAAPYEVVAGDPRETGAKPAAVPPLASTPRPASPARSEHASAAP